MNKRITIKKIMLMLYALLMCLPLISVGFRSLYVTFNENSFESYYGETINQKEYIYEDTWKPNEEWFYSKSNDDTTITTTTYIKCSFIEFYCSRTDVQTWFETNEDNFGGYQLIYNNNQYQIWFYDLNDNHPSNWYWGITSGNAYNIHYITANSGTISNTNNFYRIEYNNYSYLDNAFDYSLHEFIDNNNTGLINFVGLFSDMFLGNSNVENGLYLGFANFMMNYALFISCAYFVFEVLMWFINYARKWLYAFEEKGGAE